MINKAASRSNSVLKKRYKTLVAESISLVLLLENPKSATVTNPKTNFKYFHYHQYGSRRCHNRRRSHNQRQNAKTHDHQMLTHSVNLFERHQHHPNYHKITREFNIFNLVKLVSKMKTNQKH